MAYLPKSKHQIKETGGDQFVYKGTSIYYRGFYIETSSGKYYAGNKFSTRGRELMLASPSGDLRPYEVRHSHYNKIKPGIYSRLVTTKAVVSTKPTPIKEDYEKGRIIRFFAKRRNQESVYFEIDKDTFKSIRNKKKEYDFSLYEVGKIDWALEGDVITTNKNLLKLKERKYPNISLLFPILNEFQKGAKIKYNIKGRVYSDGEEIPPSLPPAYALPKKTNQFCNNCKLYNTQEQNCTLWGAKVKSGHWCKSWKEWPLNLNPEFGSLLDQSERTPDYNREIRSEQRSATNIQSSRAVSYTRGGSSGGGGGGY